MRRATKRTGDDLFTPRNVFVMLAGAVYWPWTIVSANVADVVRPDRVIAVVLGLMGLSIAVGWGLTRVGAPASSAALAACGIIAILSVGRSLVLVMSRPAALGLVVVVVVLLAMLARRLESTILTSAVGVALGVMLLSGPALRTIGVIAEWNEGELARTSVQVARVIRTPDILLVVLDGYPGLVTWRADLRHLENEIASDLVGRGFQVPESAWSAYPRTRYSFASLMDMGYPATREVTDSGLRDLYGIISGDNAFTKLLSDAGYEVVNVGSNWSGFFCGRVVLICHDARFLDEMTSYIIFESVIGSLLLGPSGHPFTAGTEEAMDWAKNDLVETLESAAPTLVVMHMMIPHRPLVFDRDCSIITERVRRGVETGGPQVGSPEWDGWFEDQTACANSWLLATLDKIPSSTTVVVVSDHGSERRFHRTQHWDTWALSERLNVLAAMRTEMPECRLGDPVMLPNVLRQVLACMIGEEVEDVEHRMFTFDMKELSPSAVERIVSSPMAGRSGQGP